jgi:mono/diheme cytochrome c family protein
MTRTYILAAAIAGTGLLAIGGGLGGALAQRSSSPGFGGGYPYKTGEETFTHVCQGCHMPDGKGAVGAAIYGYPALAGDAKLAAGLYPALVIVNGQKAMPAFAELSDAQVADVVNYVRTHFGNHFDDAVTADQVKAVRPAPVTKENKRPG